MSSTPEGGKNPPATPTIPTAPLVSGQRPLEASDPASLVMPGTGAGTTVPTLGSLMSHGTRVVDRLVERIVERPVDVVRFVDVTVDRPFEVTRTVDRVVDRMVEKPVETMVEVFKPVELRNTIIIEKPVERIIESMRNRAHRVDMFGADR